MGQISTISQDSHSQGEIIKDLLTNLQFIFWKPNIFWDQILFGNTTLTNLYCDIFLDQIFFGHQILFGDLIFVGTNIFWRPNIMCDSIFF